MKRKPAWIKKKIRSGGGGLAVSETLSETSLNTVCKEAGCPNREECWSAGTATFLILGDRCSRNCGFCGVESGPESLPPEREPGRVARAIDQLELDYAVITSVTRDNLPDGGAYHWVRTIRAVRQLNPDLKLEVLVPDFQGDEGCFERVLGASPDVLNHNVETVPELYYRVRPGASYQRSLDLLRLSASFGLPTKSGLMLGLGESEAEVADVIKDLYESGVRYLTIGQYLSPGNATLSVQRWVRPDEFEEWKKYAEATGFKHVEAGPLVRSSYRAESQVESSVN